MNNNFEKTKSWLLSSGIFISDTNNENCGSVHSFFDQNTNEFSFLYPEVTGYFLSTMRFLYDIEKNQKYLDFGKLTSNWLIELYNKNGGIIQGIYSSIPQTVSYSFDTAICAKGILDYFLISNNEKYLNFGKKLVSELQSYLEPDGTIKPLKNLKTNQFEESPKMWYKQKGCLHIKCSIPFLQLYQITKENEYLKTGLKICDAYKKFQKSDGSLILHIDQKTINLHTLCYALEGLLYGYYISKNEGYLTSIINAINWALSKIDEDGAIQLWFNSKYKEKAAYPIAQLIRIMILVNCIKPSSMIKKIKILEKFLLSLQAESENKSISGGFYEGFSKSIFGWKKIHRINSWTSMFSLQALYWINNYQEKTFEELIEYLY